MFCSIHDFTFLMTDTKIKDKSLLSLQKKETFAHAIFSKICYVACAINCAGKMIYLRACLHKHDCTGPIGKPDACKKSTASLTSFLRSCREIANLLFWVIWACLAIHI